MAQSALPNQDALYTDDDLTAAAREWPKGEVREVFAAYRSAVSASDHERMATFLSEDGRGGNATFGVVTGREAYKRFLAERWLEIIPNASVWDVVERGRVVNRWCETLPGERPGGGRYDYFGINEVIYAGEGVFRFMYSMPDLFGLIRLYGRWRADGQHERFGDLYPGLVD